ncbi:MAG: nucleotidyl transferase AbiEii/AbiGii toxin family protein [candidate division WOR-3 bacterium]|nr:nucleotidyl transferase AbiEii/AbiGii toxin family protein [candidate division WOR-3 bacterium]
MRSVPGHFEVLSRVQAQLLPKLAYLKKQKFYLAGGTALALQLGHRESVDFDFYSPRHFDAERVLVQLRDAAKRVELVQMNTDTLILKCEGVMVSLFYYPYPLLESLLDLGDVLVASVEDIAAMKLIAIIQRGRHRDFIDLHRMLESLSLESMLKLAQHKYREFNPYLAFQALVYFEDAEAEMSPRARQGSGWQAVKKLLVSEVKKLQRGKS